MPPPLALLLVPGLAEPAAAALRDGADWAAFLARADPINAFNASQRMTLPDQWLEAPFTGNAMLATQVLVCRGGICRQSLLTGTNTSVPSPDAPLQAVLPLARGDVSDMRSGNDSVVCTEWHSVVTCAGSPIWSQPKLGIGALVLQPTQGAIIGGAIRTHLHNATISVRLATTLGSVAFSVFVHAQRQLVVVEGLSATGGEGGSGLAWEFRPAPAVPPSLFSEIKDPATNFTRFAGGTPPPSYRRNPDPVCAGSAANGSCQQALLVSKEGRGWVTSWQAAGPGRLLVTITSDIPVRVGKLKTVRAAAEASAVLAAASALDPKSLAAEHTRWWEDFWWSDDSGSFLSLPAGAFQIEQFHWIQAFKIGSENACRRFVDSAFEPDVLDNCLLLDGLNYVGPTSKTKYPHAIWDLNVEAAQYGGLSANYREQTLALAKRVPEQMPNLIANVPPDLRNDSASMYINTASFSFLNEAAIDHCDFPLCSNASGTVPDLPQLTRPCSGSNKNARSCYFGGLPWVCHGIWLVYRHTMDEDILRDLMPMLKRATTLYLRYAVHNTTDGKLHLPMTFSPEYATLADCTFDLALFRWCLTTLLQVGSDLLPGSARADELAGWHEALRQLAPPQVDPKTGSLMIGDGVPLHSGLKMWSHIFSVFPLGLLDWHTPKDRELWTKSLALLKFYNNPERCESPSCVDGGSPTGTVQSREGFAYLSMGLLTMLAKPSLPGGAPPEWAEWGLGNVTERFFNPAHVPQLGAGTMYADHAACGPVPGCREGMAGPCNESPIMASLALQQMLLQSWNGRPIAIFPAVPASWKDARFARMRAEGAVLVTALRANFTTIFVALNATVGGNASVHTTIIDLVSSSADVAVSPSSNGQGVFDISVSHAQPWTTVLYSRARGPPTESEMRLALTPLAPGKTNLWGSREPGNWTLPSTPPPPGPLPPLPPCPSSGCAGCGGCKWPYANDTLPDPKQPVSGSLADATTLACEAKCGSMADCAGFTRKDAERDCYFYSKSQVSGQFTHTRPDVSWHPNPKSVLHTKTDDVVLTRVLMTEAAKTQGAVCLDGSAGGFYYAPAKDPTLASSWILNIEGGGWCSSPETCAARAFGPTAHLGSSANWLPNMTVGTMGLFSTRLSLNPDLAGANHVYFKYCGGNSFASNRDDAVVVGGRRIYFRGKRLLSAILTTLLQPRFGLRKATDVLLSGCSAGGLAAYLHADDVGAFLAKEVPGLRRYKMASDSGFFVDHRNIEGLPVYEEQMRSIFFLSNASAGVNRDCIAAQPASEQWRCNLAQYTYRHVRSPTFVIQSALDSWQTACILLGERIRPDASFNPDGTVARKGFRRSYEFFPNCSASTSVPVACGKCMAALPTEFAGDSMTCLQQECDGDSFEAFAKFEADFVATITRAPTFHKEGNGAFIHSCFSHCAGSGPSFATINVDETSMKDAFSAWWNGVPNRQANFRPCAVQGPGKAACNPTCAETGLKSDDRDSHLMHAGAAASPAAPDAGSPTRLHDGRLEAVDDSPVVTATPTLVARWNQSFNDLPSQGMPPGPIAGNGDLGLALQTGANGSGAVELWLGLNQFSGAPNRSEAFGGRSVADLIADRNFTNGPDGTLQQTTPFPRIVALGGVTIASDYFAGKAVGVDAAQYFSNGTLMAHYTRLDSGETFATRSVLDPDANRVATSVNVCAERVDIVRINITTWTTTLFVNATPAATVRTTQAGLTSEGVQHFCRQPIPENSGRVVDGYRGCVATQISGGIENCTRRHRVLFNATAAEVAGLPTDAVPIGAQTQLTLSHGGSSQTADSGNLQCASLTVVTTALTNLDLGDLRFDPLSTLLRNTNQNASEVAATALDIQHRCNRTWTQWWTRSKISLPNQPTLQEFWTVAQYMLFATAKPIGSPTVRALGAAVGPIWGPWTTSDDSGWANGPYVTDYNMMAPLYGALSSNHADSMLSYFAAVEAFAHRHGRAGAIATAQWTELRDTERNAAVAAAAAGGADVGPGRNLSQCMLSSEAIHLPCGIGPRGHLSGGNGPSPFGDWKQRWCGVYTALPFLWYYEYTRNATFGRERLLPLLRGLGAFWRCWLVRVPNSTSGNYVLGDFEDSVGEQGWYSGCSEEMGCRIDWPWSPTNNPSGCCIRWRDPIFATAQNRRLFSSLGALARELNEPEEAWWQEMVAHLPPLTVGSNAFNDTTWLMAADRMPRGTCDRHWLGAFASGMFGGMWPVHPAETVDADSAPAQIAMARATARSLFIVEEQSVAVQFFPPAVRASIDMKTPIPCGVDWTHRPNETNPTPMLRCLKLWLQWTTSYGSTPPDRPWSPIAERTNKFPYIVRPGQPYGCGGTEEIGTVDAINTMLLATTSGSGRDVLRLFPVWRRMQTAPDAAGPASFTRLVAKGGFEVSAEYDDVMDLVSDVRVRSLAGMTCAIASPWHEGKPVPSQSPPRVVHAGNTSGDVAVAVRWVVDDRFNRSVFEFNTTAGETYFVGA